jgi:hypothetical protein
MKKLFVVIVLAITISTGFESVAQSVFDGKWVANLEKSTSVVKKDYSNNRIVGMVLSMMKNATLEIVGTSVQQVAVGKKLKSTGKLVGKNYEFSTGKNEKSTLSKIGNDILMISTKSGKVNTVVIFSKK